LTPHPDVSPPDALCQHLARLAATTDAADAWPVEQLRWCAEAGVFRWFVPVEWGGWQWTDAQVIAGYLRLSAACLTTAFIITQRTGACRRLLASGNRALQERWLPKLAAGETFATVGISHLTTSRRHLGKPALTATPIAGGWQLDGVSPWVTGGEHAEIVVLGADCLDGRQILAVVPTATPGVSAAPAARLLALSGSRTGELRLDRVRISEADLLAGPVENVMSLGVGARTGGLETSTLALGLTDAALGYLAAEALRRAELEPSLAALSRERDELVERLLALAASGSTERTGELRSRANSLVLRATQAALVAAKGAGYMAEHSVGRWCREALFFLVWSCPQPVANAALCELAGLD
jgi:alkylation response protein AidB-like acyl-CoA dehydrogenase